MSPFDFLFKKRKVEQGLLGKRQGKQGVLGDGARLLRELISYSDGRYYPFRMFSAEEIEEAIEEPSYHDAIFSSFYRGTYQRRRIFIKAYQREREYAFNEIVTVTQIKHGNVAKLLGCCFEMELPVLIYELVPDSVHRRLHDANPLRPILWEHRLRIAIEIANAITYLHIANPRPIIHRNITSSNILLDEHCRPKLCSFTFSVTIPSGETHVKMEHISGTIGYMDPHYLASGIVSEKTDVYSFGILLLELLSGKKPQELMVIYEDENILWDGYRSMKIEKDEIIQLILDNGLSMDARQVKQSAACTDIVGRCMAPVPDQRPPMKEVAQQLQLIERTEA